VNDWEDEEEKEKVRFLGVRNKLEKRKVLEAFIKECREFDKDSIDWDDKRGYLELIRKREGKRKRKKKKKNCVTI